MFRSRLVVLSGLLVLALLPLGCGKKGGGANRLTVYTALEDDQYPAYLEDFKKQHPDVDVQVVRESTGMIIARLLAEKGDPKADVVWGTAASNLLAAHHQGLLAPYAPKGLDRLDGRFRDKADPPHWVGMDVIMTAFCVNTAEAKAKNLPIPKSFKDLLDPAYKGQVVMPNPAMSGTGFLAFAALLQTMGEGPGWDYLAGLDQNMAQYTQSGSKPCKMAATGEFVVGISFDYRAVQEKQKGAPLEVVFPAEGSGWEPEANALVKKEKINPAAKTFLDWAISPSAMQLYAKNVGLLAAPGESAAPQGYPEKPLEQLMRVDLDWSARERDRILDQWTKRFGAKSEAAQ